MKVPFLDLRSQYETLKNEISAALDGVLKETAFVSGPFVEAFEKAFAAFCGTKHAIGVGSGTSALWTVLQGYGIGEGDEVITVPNTFIATAEAISRCGARPVFVDVCEDTQTMDPLRLESAVTGRTKAVIPVHLFGQTADMDPIMEIAGRHGLIVVEDACQAHGALYKGRPAGSIGHAGCFSFYPGKNLGAYGEAGAVITNDDELCKRIRMCRDHGQSEKYRHEMVGWNDRMDGFQGAVLAVKLKYLPLWNEARRRHAAMYSDLLGSLPQLFLPEEAAYAKHVYHIFAVRIPERDRVIRDLQNAGVTCGIHYPVPVHLQRAYHFMNLPRGSFPFSEEAADRLLSLPMYPELRPEQIRYVADALVESLSRSAAPVFSPGREGVQRARV